ncbi:hypothetical protein ACVWXL_003454 [Bradyrhizobium sp. GM22.5]
MSTGNTPPCSRPSVTARGDRGDLSRFGAVSPVPDDGVGASHRHVGQRQAIHGNAEICEIARDQPGAEARRGQPERRISIVEACENSARRIDRPMRRRQALHPPTLLIDQDRGISETRNRPQFRNECSNLSRRLDIALEEDEAPRAFAADKLPLGGG